MVIPVENFKPFAPRQAEVLCSVLDRLLEGVAGAVLEAQAELRAAAGLPPEEDDVAPHRRGKKAPRPDPRLTDDDGVDASDDAPPRKAKGIGAVLDSMDRQARAPTNGVGTTITVPGHLKSPKAQQAYRRGYQHAAGGGAPVSPYGAHPRGAAAWLSNAWEAGARDGSAARKPAAV